MMNRLGLVLGVAAVATLAGCKDPDYVGKNGRAPQNEVKDVQTETNPAPEKAAPETAAPMTVTVTDANGKPLDNVKTDIKVEVVEVKPAPVAVKPAEEVSTTYVVRRGDSLSKISKKYNVTISSIKRLNPQLKGDTVNIGQKLKLPGTLDVEAAPAVETTAKTAAKPATVKKGSSAYTGATVDYVVKNGDTLGGIAYGHGINIRQLKQLNSLSSDSLKIGQKLKVPAGGKAAAKTVAAKPEAAKAAPAAPTEPAKADAAAPAADVDPAANAAKEAPAPVADGEPATAAAADAAAKDEAAKAAAAAKAAPAVKTYVVQEGEDMAAVAVAWGVTASQIRELNNLGENDQLKAGQTIRLPAEADKQ